ncbi:vacuolar triacylglycerol lipase [Xylariaceae sp. FL1272]|nr:vacuolar triacylglycerol lipase [Xylariaceae sp. FL1272]
MLAHTKPWLFAAAVFNSLSVTDAATSSVETSCSTFTGIVGSNNVTQWLGIRYAAPPLGELRFEPPEDPSCEDETQLANIHGPWCLKTGAAANDTSTSEDCLFMDIYTPSHATSASKLPVYFFLQGGGFNENSNPNLDGQGLVIASNYTIIVVTFNYRVGPWGFITDGDNITPNNGLRDQRKAMEWVNKYIQSFGGDPGHVVLGGDSAGAASITLQMAAFGGKDSGLFHAAAAESVSFGPVLTIEQSQYQYDNFSAKAGCDVADSLACLRNKTAEELQEVNTNIPYPDTTNTSAPLYMWNPVIDNDFIQYLTYTAFAKGSFVTIPLIVGDDTNEGTVFTPQNTSSITESDNFLKSQFPLLTSAQLRNINALYPNPDNASCPSSGCFWRQVSNAYGDMRYTCPGQYVSSKVAEYGHGSSWNYHYDVEDPTQVAEGYGVPHTVELNAILGPSYVTDPPASYLPGGVNEHVVIVIQHYWISFIRSFDPNKYRYPGSAEWKQWDPHGENRLLFKTGGKTKMESVTSRQRKQCSYLQSIGVANLQ